MVGQDSTCREGGWMRADERALSRRMKRFESLAEPSDMRVLKEARDGDLNVLTNYYMRLPGGGTGWRGGGGVAGGGKVIRLDITGLFLSTVSCTRCGYRRAGRSRR